MHSSARSRSLPERRRRCLGPDDDFGQFLAAHHQVELLPATYVLPEPVEVPDGCVIIGNGAHITVAGSTGALRITGRHDVTIRDVRFVGQSTNPLGTGQVVDHVGVRITRSTNVRTLLFRRSSATPRTIATVAPRRSGPRAPPSRSAASPPTPATA
ncbi:hypothetical protein [Kribbella sp. NPDC048928]|uniref:hypothetical protein n=1 Tax=Kribbella sp. NPDC048928 TaxID=3364111 RepID=UPI00371C07F8